MPKENSSIHAGHRARMRSRFSETGLDGFQSHEILELLLFCVIPKRDVNPLAHALLDRFGTIDAVLSASAEELAEVPGIGKQTGEFFEALNAAANSYSDSSGLAPQHIRNIAAALRYVPDSARKSLKYGVTVLFTDRFSRPISVSSFPGRPEDPKVIRAILSKTLALHSHSAVIFCTGYRAPRPISRNELEAFQPLVAALAGIDSFAVDCILLSSEHLLSLRRENLLTGNPTEIQGNLSRWEYWLKPLSGEPQDRWYSLSLLEPDSER